MRTERYWYRSTRADSKAVYELVPDRLSMEEFSVVIPTLNEAESIGEVIDGVREEGGAEIVIVDDGSSDGTADIARERGARVIQREGANSLSLSVLEGISHASREKIVVMDGDGQHPHGKIPDILSGLDSKELFVLSREEVEGRWELHRRLMSVCAQSIVKSLFRECRQVIDPISGFFGVRKSSLDLDRMDPTGYKVLVEILVTQELETGEAMYVFQQRENGSSSIGPGSVFRFLIHVVQLKHRQVKNRQHDQG